MTSPSRQPGSPVSANAQVRQSTGLLILVTLVTALGGFLFGYDTAVINGANQYLEARFELTPTQQGMAGASAIIGCIPGAMLAGFLSDKYGRRRVLFASAILFALSAVLSAVPRTFFDFLAARWIGGLGIGATSMICPVYISELAPAHQRGRLGSLFQMGIVIGIFVTLFINASIQGWGDDAWNTAWGWRWMFGSEVVPAVILVVLLCLAPESPRWLLQSGDTTKSLAILTEIGGPAYAKHEAETVRRSLEQEAGDLRELFAPRLRRPLTLAIVLMAISQFSGINVIMYYSTKIFTTAGAGVDSAFSASVVIGLVNVAFTFVALALVDRAGRRPLLLTGLAIQVLALGATGWMFQSGRAGLPLLVAILVYIAMFAMALGPIPWILCSEIFPTRIRGRAMSLATFTIWTACLVTIQTFPILNESPAIGPARLFWTYATCSLLGFLFVWSYLPETKGKTLEEIDALWPALSIPQSSSAPGDLP